MDDKKKLTTITSCPVPDNQSQALFNNTARALGDAPREIQLRHIRLCLQAGHAYGNGVATALHIALDDAGQH